jgi:processive 1,2-diacylglycerol beta-glucosyltransferase
MQVANLIINKHYDVIITTQVTASAIVSYLKKKDMYQGRFVVTFSDFHLHPYWLFDNVDFYLANVQEQKDEMVAQGIRAEKIAVCGITIPEPKLFNKEDLRKKYGLSEGENMVLVLGGGRGLGIDTEMISEIAKAKAQIFVVCGMNEELKNNLEKFYSNNTNVRIFGFVEDLPELYSIARIVVTKPGGLTIAECLSYKLPILISSYIPGQERLNYDYLVENSLIMPELVEMLGPIEDELESGMFAMKLQDNKKVQVIVQHGSTIKEAINVL